LAVEHGKGAGLEKAAILTRGGSRFDRTKQVVTPAKAGVQLPDFTGFRLLPE
jgi:hypothetical protein